MPTIDRIDYIEKVRRGHSSEYDGWLVYTFDEDLGVDHHFFRTRASALKYIKAQHRYHYGMYRIVLEPFFFHKDVPEGAQ